jgi:hypothetical protein
MATRPWKKTTPDLDPETQRTSGFSAGVGADVAASVAARVGEEAKRGGREQAVASSIGHCAPPVPRGHGAGAGAAHGRREAGHRR